MKISYVVPFALAALLAACSQDATGPRTPSALAPTASPSALVSADGNGTYSLETDAFGNQVMIAEYAAGVYPYPSTAPAVASVTIKTVIPQLVSGSTKTPCITSTIVSIDTTPGWTASVKKPGGCDKTIEVQLSNATTKESATFSFSYIFGKTRIDGGLIK